MTAAAAHRKLDRRRDDLCADGLCKCPFSALSKRSQALVFANPKRIGLKSHVQLLGVLVKRPRLRHPTFQRIFGWAEEARGPEPFAGTPLSAISRSNQSPESSE